MNAMLYSIVVCLVNLLPTNVLGRYLLERKTISKIAAVVVITVLMSACNVFALTSTLELTDGSSVVGEIESFGNGTYTVKSSFGVLRIPETSIVSIGPTGNSAAKAKGDAGKSSENGGAATGVVPSDLTNAIISDSVLLEKVMALGNDPDVKAILNDPAAMQAIQKGDVGALLSNPSFMKILSKPDVQDISKRVQGGK